MLYIEKRPEPAALIQAKRDGLKRYDDMTTDVKTAVKKQLAEEQGGLCAYCMRRLRLDTMQIEHYQAQNPQEGESNDALTIDYGNMLGVCPGNKGFPLNIQTCDQHRGNTPLTVDPLDPQSVAQVKYMPNGVIYSDDKNINNDLQTTLNLNCAAVYLPANRKAALKALTDKINQECAGKTASKAYFQKMHAHLSRGDNGILPEYLGILLNYLDKRIKRAAS